MGFDEVLLTLYIAILLLKLNIEFSNKETVNIIHWMQINHQIALYRYYDLPLRVIIYEAVYFK